MRFRKILAILLSLCIAVSGIEVPIFAEASEGIESAGSTVTANKAAGTADQEDGIEEKSSLPAKLVLTAETTDGMRVTMRAETAAFVSARTASPSDAEKTDGEDPSDFPAEETDAAVIAAEGFDSALLILKADVVGAEEEKEAEKALEEETEGDTVIRRTTYDVYVLYDGQKVEPRKGKKVEVSFTLSEVPPEADEIRVYHHTEEGIKPIIDQTIDSENRQQAEEAEAEDAADRQYVLVSDAEEEGNQTQEADTEIDANADTDTETNIDIGTDTGTITVTGLTTGFSLYTIDLLSASETVSYLYPVYNTEGNPDSGIKEWKTGTQTCKPVESSDSSVQWKAGWYVVDGSVSITGYVTCSGAVNLILKDGCSLSVEGSDYHPGIFVSNAGNQLTIYAQSTGETMGSLSANGGRNAAGIGGEAGGTYGIGSNITINGGRITATGGFNAAGIGGGYSSKTENILINGGIIEANGSTGAAGIGGGYIGDGTDILINGGTVTATGGEYAAGIGGGCSGDGSYITINGGMVTASGCAGGAGIGGGFKSLRGDGTHITITGGTVIANGGAKGAGIGGGGCGSPQLVCAGSDITVSGGNVTATGGSYGAGIGGGSEGVGKNITISGGVIEATGGEYGAGIGGGYGEVGTNIHINGGQITAKGGKEYKGSGAGIGDGLYAPRDYEARLIYAASDVAIQAGDTEGQGIAVLHAADTDLSTVVSFHNKQYVSSLWFCQLSYDKNMATGGTVPVDGKMYQAGHTARVAASGSLVKTGHDFAGWNTKADGSGTAYAAGDSFTITESTVLYAQWTAKTYGITYVMNGGSWTGGYTPPASYTYGVGAALPGSGDITRSDCSCSFEGWYDNAECSGSPVTTIGAEETESKTFYAKWAVSYLSPIYVDPGHVNKGIQGFETKKCTAFEVIQGSDSRVTWGTAGKTTWYVASGSVSLSKGAEVSGTVNLILLDGCHLSATGYGGNAGISVTNGALTIYAQSTGSSMGVLRAKTVVSGANADGAGIGGNHEAYGVNITINGGNIEANSIYGAGIGGGSCGFGSNIIINGGSITATSASSGAGIGGGFNETGSSIILNGGTVTATGGSSGGAGIGDGAGTGKTAEKRIYAALNVSVMAGDLSASTEVVHNGEDLSDKGAFNGKRYVITAAKCRVSYDGNAATGGLEPTDTKLYDPGESVTLAGCGSLVKTGCDFAGWNTKADGTGTDYAPGEVVTITESMKLYAKWSADSYSITYVTDGGSWAEGYTPPDSYTYGIGVSLPESNKLTRAGHQFEGWYDNAGCTGNPVTQVSSNVAGNQQFYAKWTHVHGAWSFSAEGAVLTASCGESGCTLPGQKISITIKAQDKTYNGVSEEASVENAAAWAAAGLIVPEIVYYREDESASIGSAPKAAGSYRAGITAGGKTALQAFMIKPSELRVSGTKAENKTYDGTVSAKVMAGSLSGVLEGDQVLIQTATGTFDSQNAAAGKKVTVKYLLSGDAAGNYTLPDTVCTADIDQKAIHVTADNKQSRIGKTLEALTYTYAPELIGGDCFSGALSTTADPSLAKEYDILQGSLSAGDNYKITYTKGSYTVTPKKKQELSFAETSVTKTYGDADFTLVAGGAATTVSYSVSDEEVAKVDAATGQVTIKAAGTVTVTAKAEENADYAAAQVSYRLTVNKKSISVKAENHESRVGRDLEKLTYTYAPELEQGDSFSGALFTAADKNAAKAYDILQGSLSAGGNYEIRYTEGVYTVLAKETQLLSFAETSVTKTYGDADYTMVVGGAVTGVTYSCSDETVAEVDALSGLVKLKAAGTAVITATAEEDEDRQAAQTSYALTVKKKPIRVSAESKQSRIGKELEELTYTFTPQLVKEDSFSGALSTDADSKVAKVYDILQGTLSAGENYEIIYTKGSYTVLDKEAQDLSFAEISVMRTYGDASYTLVAGGAVTALSYSSSNTSVAEVDASSGRVVLKGAGHAVITAAAQEDADHAAAQTDYMLTVSAKPIQVRAENKQTSKGQELAELSYICTPGLVGQDSFSGSLSTGADKDVAGTYDILQGTLLAGKNYAISYTKGSYTVTEKEIQALSFTESSVTKTYGDADYTLKASGAQTTVTYFSSNRAVAEVDASSGRVTIKAAGTAAILASAAESDVYAAAQTKYILTVRKKAVYVTAENKQSRIGQDLVELTYTYTPELVEGNSFSGTLSTRAGKKTAGSYDILQGTLSAGGNYEISYTPGTYTVTDKQTQTLSFAKASVTKTYGDAAFTQEVSGALTALSYSSSNVDVAEVDALSGRVSIRAAGTAVITAVAAEDADHAAAQASFALTVNKKAIRVTADNKQSRIGQELLALTCTCEPELIAGDAFSGALSTGAGKKVAGSYDILQGTLTAGENYEISYVKGLYTVTEKEVQSLAFAEAAISKIYGDADFTPEVSGAATAVTYSSSNSDVAEVDELTGRVTIRGAGSAIITASAAEDASYAAAQAFCSLTVKKKPIQVTAVDKQSRVGQAILALTYTCEPGLVDGDSFSGVLSTGAGKDVAGTYDILQGTLSAGANYEISYRKGIYTVMEKETPEERDEGTVRSAAIWVKDAKGWKYLLPNGSYAANGWYELENSYASGTQERKSWFRFGADGYMLVGWFTDRDGKKYYLNPISDGTRGRMVHGKQIIDGKEYMFSEVHDGYFGHLTE